MNIDYTNKPKKSLEALLDTYSLDMYLIMDDVLETTSSYTFIYQDLIDIMKWGFEIEEIRKRPIHFKFRACDKVIHELQLNHFISNMIIWYPFLAMDIVDKLDDSFIFDFTKFNMNAITSYLDDRVFMLGDTDFHSKNMIVD